MRLAITGPTRDLIPASFAVDLAWLFAYTRDRGPWQTVTLGFVAGTYIHATREYLLESALAQGADHILWIDTDMAFAPEAAVRLAQHDRPFVGTNAVTRDGSRQFVARRGGQRIATTADSHGLEIVDATGLAFALMTADLARRLPRPWFAHGRTAQGGDVGEDLTFCQKVRDAGIDVVIDHDVSQGIGHVGQVTYYTVDPVVHDRPPLVAV